MVAGHLIWVAGASINSVLMNRIIIQVRLLSLLCLFGFFSFTAKLLV